MKHIFIILFLLVAIISFGQNLVPNPSFEEYEECPYSVAEFAAQVNGWTSWQETPDYFNTCNNLITGWAGVPANIWGYQWPITGNAYAALYTYTHTDSNIREYIATELIQPLVVGETYYISFYTSQIEGETGSFPMEYRCATNHIGLRFFKDPEYNNPNNILQPDNIAHIDYPDVLADSENWTHIEGWFTADDSYNWVALGNFFDGESTEIIEENPFGNCFGVYYIENVCVAKTQEECDYLLNIKNGLNKQNIKIYPNPTSSNISVHSSFNKDIQEIRIIDISGKISKTFNFQNEEILNINLESFSQGIYFIQIKYNHHLFNHKIIIQ